MELSKNKNLFDCVDLFRLFYCSFDKINSEHKGVDSHSVQLAISHIGHLQSWTQSDKTQIYGSFQHR